MPCLMTYMTKLAAAAVPVALLLGGCTSSGLSVREAPGRDVSSYSAASYTFSPADILGSATAGTDAEPTGRLTTPASVVVAQIGEVAPPETLLDSLSSSPELFKLVQPMSGVLNYRHSRTPSNDPVRDHLDQMLHGAASMGADYLVVYGGTLDQSRTGGPLSLLDLTIVGAFVIPSQQITGEATATAIVLDVASGQPVATASSDADRRTYSASVGAEGRKTDQARKLRDEAVEELTDSIIERFEKAGA